METKMEFYCLLMYLDVDSYCNVKLLLLCHKGSILNEKYSLKKEMDILYCRDFFYIYLATLYGVQQPSI